MDVPTPNINFDDINKFEASCGIIFIVTSIILLIFEDDKVNAPLWLIITLAILGIISLVRGLLRWSKRQKKIDRKLELEIEEQEKRLTAATESEKKENMQKKLDNDIKYPNRNKDNKTQYEITIKNVSKLIDKISCINNLKYSALTEQKLSEHFFYDAVLKGKTKMINDKIIDIKYLRNDYQWSMNNSLLKLALLLDEYRKNVSKDASLVLVLLCENVAGDYNKIRQSILKAAVDIPGLSGTQVEIINVADLDNFDANILCA